MTPNVFIPEPRRESEAPCGHGGLHAGPPPPPEGAFSLLLQARKVLARAELAESAHDRYATGYVAAVRAAHAAVVLREPDQPQSRPISVWTLLSGAAPELGDWALLFDACSERRAAAEAGIVQVTRHESDRMMTRAREFVGLVGRSLTAVR